VSVVRTNTSAHYDNKGAEGCNLRKSVEHKYDVAKIVPWLRMRASISTSSSSLSRTRRLDIVGRCLSENMYREAGISFRDI